MSLLNSKTYSYKYSKNCSVCKFCRRHPDVKKVIINLHPLNPNGMSPKRSIEYYKFPLAVSSIRNHMKNHISEIETRIENRLVNENEPIKRLGTEVIATQRQAHESTLDEFISQFDDAVRKHELKLTVKDGLQAIKIKADIVKGDKDRKKDVLRMMVGAYDEESPPSPAETG